MFGLPGGNYPKENLNRNGRSKGRVFNYGDAKSTRRQRSWDNLETSTAPNTGTTTLTQASSNEPLNAEEGQSTVDASKSFQGNINIFSSSTQHDKC